MEKDSAFVAPNAKMTLSKRKNVGNTQRTHPAQGVGLGLPAPSRHPA
jgi:hypothetical protein